jgi:UDP-2,3-diacylglucosamine pyrophosphatase LpxH
MLDVFISDVHLGTKDSGCELLDKWLKLHSKQINNIYLVGDIIDMWRLKYKSHWPQSHVNFVRRILSFSRSGKNVYYIIGNHDGHLNDYTNNDLYFELGNMKVCRTAHYHGYLVLHGDQFDPYKIFSHIGDRLYGLLCMIAGKKSGSIKNKVKKFFQDKFKMREQAIKVAMSGKHRGIICGHTHVPEISEYYINCGDMIENFTLITFENGENPQLIYLKNEQNTLSN